MAKVNMEKSIANVTAKMSFEDALNFLQDHASWNDEINFGNWDSDTGNNGEDGYPSYIQEITTTELVKLNAAVSVITGFTKQDEIYQKLLQTQSDLEHSRAFARDLSGQLNQLKKRTSRD